MSLKVEKLENLDTNVFMKLATYEYFINFFRFRNVFFKFLNEKEGTLIIVSTPIKFIMK